VAAAKAAAAARRLERASREPLAQLLDEIPVQVVTRVQVRARVPARDSLSARSVARRLEAVPAPGDGSPVRATGSHAVPPAQLAARQAPDEQAHPERVPMGQLM
jgi:hypothetical protein